MKKSHFHEFQEGSKCISNFTVVSNLTLVCNILRNASRFKITFQNFINVVPKILDMRLVGDDIVRRRCGQIVHIERDIRIHGGGIVEQFSQSFRVIVCPIPKQYTQNNFVSVSRTHNEKKMILV